MESLPWPTKWNCPVASPRLRQAEWLLENSNDKMAMTKYKGELVFFKTRMGMPVTIHKKNHLLVWTAKEEPTVVAVGTH